MARAVHEKGAYFCAPFAKFDDCLERLALGELEGAPCLGPAVLLALDHARVAGEEAAALERAAQIRLVIGQRLGNAVAARAGLAGQTAAGDRAGHVVLP